MGLICLCSEAENAEIEEEYLRIFYLVKSVTTFLFILLDFLLKLYLDAAIQTRGINILPDCIEGPG